MDSNVEFHFCLQKMDNMNNAYQSSSEISMTPGAIQKLVNDIVSVVLEGTTVVYPRRETGILGNQNPVNFMKYRPPHLKIQEGMINPTINHQQGIRHGMLPNGNNQKRKLPDPGTVNPVYCNIFNAQDRYRKHLENRMKYQHQLGINQIANRNCLVAPVSGSGYLGTLPWCKKCNLHHVGKCRVRCMKCQKLGHQTISCRTKEVKVQPTTIVCHGCGGHGHHVKRCPNYNVNWKAKTFTRK